MIRFNCPHCGRAYSLPDALAKLSLVCKQCNRNFLPAPSQTIQPDSLQPAPSEPTAPAKPPAVPRNQEPKPAGDLEGVLLARPDSTPDIDFNLGGPTATSRIATIQETPAAVRVQEDFVPPPEAAHLPGRELTSSPTAALPPSRPALHTRSPEAVPPADKEPKSPRNVLPFVADLIVYLVLGLGGMFLGELLVGKHTGTVLIHAGAAPKFPPIELLLWAAPAVLFVLIYTLLVMRRLSLGAWLRKRNEN